MPADRKKCRDAFKQSHFETQFDLQWTAPVEYPSQMIEFTTNVTPTSYTDDTPPPLQPPTAYIFPPEEPGAPSDAPKPRGRKGSGYIPRPPNAFILFRSSFIKSQHVTSAVETNHSTLSKIIGMTWQNLPNDERQAWHGKAKEALEEHKRKWPQYAFKPASSKAQPRKKRRVRETEPKDIKRCEKIVELLCNGKKGDELKDAVKDFDKSHVPQFVTRFEAPITARAYRRSSSAPLPDTDYKQAKQAFLPPSSPLLPHRKRSSSAEPEFSMPSSSDIKLPTSGLLQFNPAYSVGSLESQDSYEYPVTKQEPGFIDFSAYSFGVTGQPCNSYPSLFGDIETSPSPSLEYSMSAYGPRKPSFTRASLSINTDYLNQWANPQDSPVPTMPGSPSFYSPSSPSESSSTPYSEDVYSAIDESYHGFNPLDHGYSQYHMDMSDSSTCASSPTSMYYPEFSAPKAEYLQQQYVPDMGLDYSTYGMQPTYTV